MRKCKKYIPIAVLLFLSEIVLAHPGHGNEEIEGNSLLHYLTESVHIVSFVLIILIVLLIKFLYGNRKINQDADQ